MTDNDVATFLPPLPGEQPGLRWGVKASFIRYVTSLPDGSFAASGGVSVGDGNQFIFPLAADGTYDADAGTGILKFMGTISISGHGGMMQVTISNPWVEFHRNETLLTVAALDDGGRVPLAILSPGKRAAHNNLFYWLEIPAALAPEGTFIFNDQYFSGDQLDALHVAFDPASPYR